MRSGNARKAYQTAPGERPRQRAEATLPSQTLSRQYSNLVDRARDQRRRQEVTQQGAVNVLSVRSVRKIQYVKWVRSVRIVAFS